MLEALTGAGLAASAGLNAWIPLLVIGLLNRFTDLITLPHGWAWLSNGWVLLILAVLLGVEVVADKVPVLDSVNDAIHTVIRPTAGGIAFGASSESQTVTVTDPGSFFHSHQWIPIASGALIALCLHGVKATVRPVANTVTVGTAAPVLSTVEDIFSTVMSVIAVVIPILVIGCLALLGFAVWRVRKRAKRRKAEKAAAKAARRVDLENWQ